MMILITLIANIGAHDFKTILASLINYEGAVGKLRMVEVATTDDNFFTNPESASDMDVVMRNLIDLDENGDPVIRVGFQTFDDSAEDADKKYPFTQAEPDQMFRSVIGKTAEGKAYLRIALTPLA